MVTVRSPSALPLALSRIRIDTFTVADYLFDFVGKLGGVRIG